MSSSIEISSVTTGGMTSPRLNGSARVYWLLIVVTIGAGLVLRLAPLGLPFAVTKWGGSVLWAVMVYLLLAVLLPRSSAARVAVIAGLVAAAVELSRLYHTPGLDAFRLSAAGALLLGRVFSLWHFTVYWAAIGCAALGDQRFLRRRVLSRFPTRC